MQDETLSQPLPLPRPRRRGELKTALVALVAFAVGGSVVGGLVHAGRLPYALPPHGLFAAGTHKATVAQNARPQAGPAEPAEAGNLVPLETRLALLEGRFSRIDSEADNALGNAARSEALLIAFAARRRVDRGQPLGYIEEQLRLRFANAQPKAVETVIAAARKPITLEELYTQLEAAAPALTGTLRGESTWTRVRRELSGLFVIRRAPVSPATPQDRIAHARLMLAGGKIDEAIAEVGRMPGAEGADAWIEAALRYEDTQRALDVIETAAMLEPHKLHDSAGRQLDQVSPLVPPANAAPMD
ncbi:MAG: hypothetical protein LBV50_06995 [Novosphingobium sp.]|jgi:hypothetical protein|nr:hypothetical protein [Novosphingobium sp.]